MQGPSKELCRMLLNVQQTDCLLPTPVSVDQRSLYKVLTPLPFESVHGPPQPRGVHRSPYGDSEKPWAECERPLV